MPCGGQTSGEPASVGPAADQRVALFSCACVSRHGGNEATTPQSITNSKVLPLPSSGPCILLLYSANFILPMVYVLPAQLLTLLGVTGTSRYAVCLMMDRPGYLLLSQQLCQGLKVSMHYLSMLLGRPPKEAAAAAASECAGVDGLVLVVLFANLLLLVVVPCLVVYFVELDLKRGFIRTKNLVMQHAGPIVESRLGKAVVVYGAVVGSWMACEVLVLGLSPFECSKGGQITPSRWL